LQSRSSTCNSRTNTRETAPQDGKTDAQRYVCVPASWRWPCACLERLAPYPEADLERLKVKVRLGQQLIEAGILAHQVHQTAGLIGPHAAVLRAPLEERGLAEPALAADLLDRQASLGLLQKPDYLPLLESTLPHVRHSLG
jgi:hypothetical protein